MFNIRAAFCSGVALLMLCATGASAQTVAITFDDLPAVREVPAGMTNIGVATNVIHALQAAHVPPTYGMVVAQKLQLAPDNPDVLKLWVASGNLLGNHTWSHPYLDNLTVEAFEKQITDDEDALKTYSKSGADWHWFRYPYLHEGDTLEKHKAIKAFLKDNHYRIADVTLDFDDYAWNAPLARCAAKHDEAGIAELKSFFLQNAGTFIDFDRQMSHTLYHRDIPYVVMLHMGAIESLMLPQLLDLLKQKGFTFITLEKAESDPAYRDDPIMGATNGGTLLEQIFIARHLDLPSNPEKPFNKLNSICQ